MNRKDKMFIMMTVLGGPVEKVKILFKKYKLIKDESYFDYELLKRALCRKDYPIIAFLIKENYCRVVNPNKTQDTTPLHLAVFLDKSVKEDIIKALIERGASVHHKNEKNETVLFSAFKQGQVLATDVLLDYSEMKDFNPADEHDIAHFYIACVRCHFKTIKLFLHNGFVNSPFVFNSSKWINIYPKFNEQDARCAKLWNDSYCHYYKRSICSESTEIELLSSEKMSDLVYFTPLHFNVRYGFEDIVELLLMYGADCNKRDKDGRSPLHLACQSYSWNEKKIIDLLLDFKACTTLQDNNGRTPLHIAFYNKNEEREEIFETLLLNAQWNSYNYTDKEGLSYFHIACAKSNVSVVQDFLNYAVPVNGCVVSGDYKGFTALHFAVSRNQKEIVEFLLNKKADVNIKTNDGFTPLHLACRYFSKRFRDLIYDYNNPKNANWVLKRSNQLDIIKGLIAHGADIGIKDKLGKNPLHHLCKFEENKTKSFKQFLVNEISMIMEEIIKMFLSKEESSDDHRINPSSILLIISRHFDFIEVTEKLIKFLLTEGADLSALDDTGLTALHIAVQSNNKDLVQILLNCNANPNVKCKDSKIPLQMIAVHNLENSYKDIFCMLLKYGSDVNIINEDGKTMFFTAIAKDCQFIVKQLLYYGADINLLDDLSIIPKRREFMRYYYGAGDEYRLTLFNFELFKIVFSHVQKLLTVGFHVKEQIKEDCNKLYSDFCGLGSTISFNHLDIFDEFKKELNRLKLEVISYTSLYSILLKDTHDVSKYVRNSSIFKIIMDDNFDKKFPFYGNLLKIQFKKAIVRRKALESAIAALNHVLRLSLPDSCSDIVLKFLTNEEVADLKAAMYL